MTVDEAGNRQTENFGAEAIDYRYDADHRLTEVIFADGSQLQRVFDPMGRCVQEARSHVLSLGPRVHLVLTYRTRHRLPIRHCCFHR